MLIFGDSKLTKNFSCDHGIVAQTILLAATESGLGGCMIAAFDKKGLAKELQVPERYEPLLVVALGKPREKIIIEDGTPPEERAYWRDDEEAHHVPKRPLKEILLPY